MERWEQPDR
jgi:hypothetical protein